MCLDSLYYPCIILKHFCIPNIHTIKRNKNIYMKSLNFRFREFFSINSMFFSEREMDSYFSFMKVYILQGSSSRDGRIKPKSELTNHNFTLILYHPVI